MEHAHAGWTDLHTAAQGGDVEAVRALLAQGADPNAREAGDIAATLAWYTSIGFTEIGRHEEDGVVSWGMTSFGRVEIMLGMMGTAGPRDVSLWIYTGEVDELYRLFKARQLSDPTAGIVFEEELYDPFYGGRQFSIRDPNGYGLVFYNTGAG